MIEVTDINGRKHLLNPDGIVRVSEAATSCQWHGIRSHIVTMHGATIECQQSTQEVKKLLMELELRRLASNDVVHHPIDREHPEVLPGTGTSWNPIPQPETSP
ncbi:hypothetical protein [Delftia tsuruhatensis]|uniref:Cation transporter n=1 Tax=Delftia tsuruhatensis TaxID=180282 RepID=A0ABM6E5N9_9BURK|nr:hypothetical protein [Delftia tsuruhatensis]AOV02767.1 hypothetical protein BI380_16185 [Delftia tsuruhatensis]